MPGAYFTATPITRDMTRLWRNERETTLNTKNRSGTLYLASRSPRRRQLLEQIGLSPTIIDIDIDESRRHDEAPHDYVLRMAREKAAAGLAVCLSRDPDPQASPLVVAADTAVVVDRQVLGKPMDATDGRRMLSLLSNRQHQVLTAVTVIEPQREESQVSDSLVTMRAISADEIAAYWGTGEPGDKAGAYGIQGLGAIFISHITGSYSGIMGLPLFETASLLNRMGIVPIHRLVQGPVGHE